MAERRMFTQKITESDAFLDMSLTAQALYFHLCMYADDDGFVKNPKRIAKMVGAQEDDLNLLVMKSFVLTYQSGVIVIKHWRMHNLLRKDRYSPSEYIDEKALLRLKDNGAYTFDEAQGKPLELGDGNHMATKRQPHGNHLAPQDSIGKDSIGKDSKGKDSIGENKEPKRAYGEYHHVKLTDKEKDSLIKDLNAEMTEDCIRYLDEYIEMKGTKYKSHYLVIRKWVIDAVKEQKAKKPIKPTPGDKMTDDLQRMADWSMYNEEDRDDKARIF